MRASLLCCVTFIACLVGCSPKPTEITVTDATTKATTPQERTFEQIRSGLFQVNAGMDSIEEAVKAAREKQTTSLEVKELITEIVEYLDSAGEALAEEAADEPKKTETLEQLGKRKKQLVDLVNDSLHDLREGRGIVDSLATEEELGPLEDIGILIDVAMDDLRGALEALGGKEEIEE